MPIIVPNKEGARGLYETSYSVLSSKLIHELEYEVSQILKKNLDKLSPFIYAVTGGPVYVAEEQKWYQAIVAHRNY